jgi:hypothetical protein
MRHRIFWMMIVGVPLALITLAAGTAAALPAARHLASGMWNAPARLPALPENSQTETLTAHGPLQTAAPFRDPKVTFMR